MSRPIRNVLVANRGEIAVRVFRACTELGIRTSAIYSHEDRLSIHRYKADRAFLIGTPGRPIEAYLDIEAILAIALERGADAIHPGYGFLSERADFAAAVRDAGLTWIGPPPEAMRALGDKISARRVAERAGVQAVPGTPEAIADLDEARAFADSFGYPIMIKAAHGGGGRGMRIARAPDELEDAWDSARREARAAFGRDEMFVERYLVQPRHIEVQLLADAHGQIAHLYERDCSVQRRHQKIVEIAPAPALLPETRRRLCEGAVAIGREAGYESAGTVEFLVERRDGQDEPYFIEVNTRLQVEHTVTEMVTGVDIVQAMILIAQGARLDDAAIGVDPARPPEPRGYAIQARVTTEDPSNDFAPDTGRIETYRAAAGFGIRLDAGVAGAGAIVTPHYDSLLVKVSAWGRDLAESARRLGRSLAEFRVRGVRTNLPFLQNVVAHPAVIAGETHTQFVDETSALFDLPARRDRANKALRAISEITLHGPPGAPARFLRPPKLIEPVPPSPPGPAPKTPAWTIFQEEGPEGVSRWLRAQEAVQITDTTFRDAHQSLLATRVRTRDLEAAAPAHARLMPDLFSYEMWGGATFDVCMRFLSEDPWERVDRLRRQIPGALFQMLFRGKNAVGYSNYPDEVIRDFIGEAADSGIDLFRIFDALNYVPNMTLAIEEVARRGKIAEACVCYTGDVGSPKETKYTLDYYTELARDLERRGAHIIAIKDMAGLLKPRAARLLIPALKDAVDLPIHLHMHDTSGNGIATYLAAVEVGVDALDCALSSMAGLTSQPSYNALVAALEDSPRRPEADPAALDRLAAHWESVRALYAPFESELRASTTEVYVHEIPGGQYSNLRPRAVQLGLGARWDEIKRTYREVDHALGRIIKVTPTSKVVADLAMFLVQNDLTIEELIERSEAGTSFDLPRSVLELVAGRLGEPYGGIPERTRRALLGDGAPEPEAGPAPLDEAKLEAALGRPATERERISAALYSDVFLALAARQREFGAFSVLDTPTFLYGIEPGEERWVDLEEGKRLIVVLREIGEPDEAGERVMYFELNGQPRALRVVDRTLGIATKRIERADPSDPGQVGATMPGAILSVEVSEGDEVERGHTIAVAEAMKMETRIKAQCAGRIVRLAVAAGDRVEANQLVAVIEQPS